MNTNCHLRYSVNELQPGDISIVAALGEYFSININSLCFGCVFELNINSLCFRLRSLSTILILFRLFVRNLITFTSVL